jgi:hypothetical protein
MPSIFAEVFMMFYAIFLREVSQEVKLVHLNLDKDENLNAGEYGMPIGN